jgi:TonB family protein
MQWNALHDHPSIIAAFLLSIRLPAVPLCGTFLALALNACYSSTINTDAPQRANATLANMERGISPASQVDHDQVVRLWRDKPQYAALANAKHVRQMRMISAAAPEYPIVLRFTHVEALVKVSFVVGIDGRVEDARVIESSDSRFDSAAVEAMRKFVFLPAEGIDGPESSMEVQPFNFHIKK